METIDIHQVYFQKKCEIFPDGIINLFENQEDKDGKTNEIA